MFENKKILILGMARSGYEAAKVLAKRNNQVIINDSSELQDPEHIKELEKLGVKIVLGSHPDDILTDDFDYLIKNPGIRNDHKYVLYCKEHEIPVINEIQMAYHLLPPNVTIVGITGTNGKTTTTTLIYEVLKNGKRTVHLTGNIGFPVSGFLDKVKENDIIVMEIAGHHLANFIDFKTDISVLTNLSEAHLDFHGNYENYINTKKRIFNFHDQSNLAIINAGNEDCMKITSDIKSTKEYFSSTKITNDASLENNFICYRGEKLIDTTKTILKGNHNFENMMCAIIVGMHLGIDKGKMTETLTNFKGVEHRIEYVREYEGVTYYNDSKSTNNKATQIALKTFTEPTIIIMGGLDRGQSFDELKDYVDNVKVIICYGETKSKIHNFSVDNDLDCIVVDNLTEAVNASYEIAEKGDIVLLSPACASWDQYKCFEDRGDEFKKIVNELK